MSSDDRPRRLRGLDLRRSAPFYDAIFFALGARRMFESEHAIAYGINGPEFWIVVRGRAPGPGYGHIALHASGKAAVDAATGRGSPTAASTTALPASGRSTGAATTPVICGTRTGCGSRSSRGGNTSRPGGSGSLEGPTAALPLTAVPAAAAVGVLFLRRTKGENRPMSVRVGINGFGRIGRNVFRAAHEQEPTSSGSPSTTSSTPRRSPTCSATTRTTAHSRATSRRRTPGCVVDGKEIRVLAESDPAALPWGDLGVDVVIESTGLFTNRENASKHLDAGAKKVVISAPATNPDATVVLGVNFDEVYDRDQHHVISNASCTTNCLAPVAKVLHDTVGIKHGLMTTIHAYTADQRLHRHAPPRPAARPRGGDQPDSRLDRRREGDRARDPGAERQAARLRRARARPRRQRRRPHRRGQPRDERRGGQRGDAGGRRAPGRSRASSGTPRTRSSHRTSSRTRPRRSSTRS